MDKGYFVFLKAQMYNFKHAYMGTNFFFVVSVIIFLPSPKPTLPKGNLLLTSQHENGFREILLELVSFPLLMVTSPLEHHHNGLIGLTCKSHMFTEFVG